MWKQIQQAEGWSINSLEMHKPHLCLSDYGYFSLNGFYKDKVVQTSQHDGLSHKYRITIEVWEEDE